jgi:hypothetical protein
MSDTSQVRARSCTDSLSVGSPQLSRGREPLASPPQQYHRSMAFSGGPHGYNGGPTNPYTYPHPQAAYMSAPWTGAPPALSP